MTTRRAFIQGTAASFLVAPRLVRATSLDFVPRHRYFAYQEIGSGVFDILRGDGRVMGWLTPHELGKLTDRTQQTLLAAATQDITEQGCKVFGSIYQNGDSHTPPVPLSRLLHV